MDDVCQKCKLHENCKSPFMQGSGSVNPDILFIGEGPGAEEDIAGEPFVGRSGRLLRDTLEVLEFNPEKYRFTNTVRCRPPDNRDPKNNELKYCSKFLFEEIKEVQPKVIVLLGNSPLKSVLGQSGISHWNGQVIEREDYTYIPAYHPAFILRNGARQDLLTEWCEAFEKAQNVANGMNYERGDAHYQYLYPEYVDELEAMRDEILACDYPTAYDTETVNVKELFPDNKIVSVAFATRNKAWSFPIDHEDTYWTDREYDQLISIMAEILTHAKIIGHNVKFDCRLTRRWLDIDFQPYGDTMLLGMLANAHYLEHGLKRYAGLYLGMYDYDKDLRDYIITHPEADYKKGGHYGNIPLDVLLPYGGMDVSATSLLHDKIFEELSEAQQALYLEMIMPADYALGRMQSFGFLLDMDQVERQKHIYEIIKSKQYAELLKDEDAQVFISAKQKELDDNWNGKTKRKFFTFNPNSSLQMVNILYDLKGYDPPGFTEKGKPSIKKDLLKEIQYDLAVEDYEDKFLDDYMHWKLLSSVLSKTYNSMLNQSKDWWSPDYRVRSTITIGGAKTGRTSSKRPNTQNIPTPEKEPGTVLQYMPVKNVFTHTWEGGCLAMVDYAGMELRVIASVADITGMLDVFNRGGDVHRYVSSLIYKKPENEITKFERYRGKWCNWSLLYRGGWTTLYRMYRINGLTQKEAQRITKLYYASFPELIGYHERIEAFVHENKFVQSLFGRILQLPEVESNNKGKVNDVLRTAVNMPIQGTASDTLMCALSIIDYYMRKKDFQSRLVNTVHDSIVVDIYPGELEDFTELSTDVMENIIDYADEFMPGLDFSWLKVPLKADVDVGEYYGTYGSPAELTCDCGFPNFVYVGEHDAEVGYKCTQCAKEISIDLDGTSNVMLYNQTQPKVVATTERLQLAQENGQPIYAGMLREPRLK